MPRKFDNSKLWCPRIITKIITDDETFVHYYGAQTNQESRIFLIEY